MGLKPNYPEKWGSYQNKLDDGLQTRTKNKYIDKISHKNKIDRNNERSWEISYGCGFNINKEKGQWYPRNMRLFFFTKEERGNRGVALHYFI